MTGCRLAGAVVVAGAVLASGCASSGGAADVSPDDQDRVHIRTGRGSVTAVIREEPGEAGYLVEGVTAAEAWPALQAAYGELEIPIKAIDPGTYRVGNPAHRVHRRMAGQRASTFLDCGSGVSTERADSYRIEMAVGSQLLPVDGGVRVVTRLRAEGRAVGGTSSNRVTCTSTGALEALVGRLVHVAVAM